MNEHTDLHTKADFKISDTGLLKRKMLNWASRFNIFLFLDNQQYHLRPQRYECLLGAGARTGINDINGLDAFATKKSWRFGHLAYNLKEKLHGLTSPKEDQIGFSETFFFEPEVVLVLRNGILSIEAAHPHRVWQELTQTPGDVPGDAPPVLLTPRLTQNAYLHVINQLKEHISRGDCYEINFCQEFFAEKAVIQPVYLFHRLMQVSPAPFSALYRYNDCYLLSASPERFITKSGHNLIAQPMKGTAKRSLANPQEDEQLKKDLLQSPKERSENVMVVDLMRNDLSQICKEASVQVTELYGIYTFPQVHQMVSTISGEIKPDVSFTQLLQATFPMGSMTGAPKLRVMQLIDQYELTSRGIFSGSVGYMSPDGDFDFNVVIRSILYNAQKGYLSCPVGSGITFYSNATEEWEECLLKVSAIRKVLGGTSDV